MLPSVHPERSSCVAGGSSRARSICRRHASSSASASRSSSGQRICSIVEEVAERLGAAVGASRIVVDGGVLPRARQIGASGKWLAADVYLACGVSGSSYHMMGVKAVKHLVAVNLDRSAPIFQHAELGVVGDLFEILPALSALLAAA